MPTKYLLDIFYPEISKTAKLINVEVEDEMITVL